MTTFIKNARENFAKIVQRCSWGKSSEDSNTRGVWGRTPRKLFEAAPFTLAKNASPNIMLAIGYKET